MEYPFPIYPIDNSPGFIINRLAREINACLYREFRKQGHEITAQQWAVLSRIRECEGLHQSELAERTVKNRHNMTRILSQFSKKGLIDRRSDSKDKRLLRVYLTQKGEKLHDQLIQIAMETVNKVFKGISQRDIAALRMIHNQLINNINKITQTHDNQP